ncbi:MAG TPA: trimeric intracellular cation channel family protein [Gammaproteobacteria bacterium]|nr:trimeric intracellular cation channel family protein [Gammaproteobacteria bacterium]
MLYLFDLAGVAVFAVSGALVAGRKSLDIFGVFIIAVVTAIGGGTLRDLLLDRHPLFWVEDPTYLLVISIAAFATMITVRVSRPPRQVLLVADALGLAVFCILGVRIAVAAGTGPLIAVLMGTMSGVAGGMLRDVLCGEVPLILRRDLYATAALAGASVYLLLHSLQLASPLAGIIGMLIVVGLRLAAIFLGWRLPIFRLPDNAP